MLYGAIAGFCTVGKFWIVKKEYLFSREVKCMQNRSSLGKSLWVVCPFRNTKVGAWKLLLVSKTFAQLLSNIYASHSL